MGNKIQYIQQGYFIMPTKKKWDPSTYKQVTPTLTPIIKETPREKIIFPTKYKIIPESITQQNSSSNVYVNKKEFLDSPVFKPYMDRLYEINSRPNSRRDINPQALYKDIQSYIHKDLESKEYSEDKIKSYYKKYGKNVEEVKKIQQDLVDKGYNIGTNKLGAPNIDGKFGSKTLAAYKAELEKVKLKGEVNNSRVLPEKIYSNIAKFSKESTCNTPECATFVSNVYDLNILGHAWDMKDNIEKNNGIIKYNIYSDSRFKDVADESTLKNITKLVKKNNKASKELFSIGDIVGLYNSNSTYHSQAIREGKGTMNTHVGFVSSFKNGVPIITHNIKGKLYHSPYNQLSIGWIGTPNTKIYELKNSSPSKDLLPTIQYYANSFNKIYGNSLDPNEVTRDIYGILNLETGLGKHTPTEKDIKQSMTVKKFLGKNADISGISMGIGKLKLNSFTPQEKTMLGLTPESIQEKETAIKAATYLYLKNRKQFEEYAEKNPQLNITEDDIRYMTILSYNQGTKKLLNLGYNNIYKSPQEEVETLRELATPKKIKDVTSTKFQYLPGVLKDWAYSMKYPEGHIPYINRVLNHGNKVDLALIAGNF